MMYGLLKGTYSDISPLFAFFGKKVCVLTHEKSLVFFGR
jgi:hypothetical protein